jgi:tRNA A37 threonylcarbamoyladenosine dehydratase
MAVPPEQAARIGGRVNLELLATQLVVVVGVGTVGSQVALELANVRVGLRLIDHDRLKAENLPRYALKDRRYLHMNKAEAMTLYLADVIGTTKPEAVPLAIDDSLSDYEVDELLSNCPRTCQPCSRRWRRRYQSRPLASWMRPR